MNVREMMQKPCSRPFEWPGYIFAARNPEPGKDALLCIEAVRCCRDDDPMLDWEVTTEHFTTEELTAWKEKNK